jgi:RHS repeat-associated protein
MRKAVDVNGFALTVEYDWIGRRTAMQSADTGRKEYYFNSRGGLDRENDGVLRGKGKDIRYIYDQLNRLVKIDYPDSEDTVYEYGAPGAADGTANRIKKLTDETGTTEYEYGALGETVEETRTIKILTPGQATEKTRAIGYTSNYLGQMEAIRYHDGSFTETVRYGYNHGGQIKTVTGQKGNTPGGTFAYVNDIGYDEFGQRVFIEYGNGVKTAYTYNPARRWLDKIVTTDDGGGVIQNMAYDINPAGNVNGYTNDADLYTTSQTYTYDDLYQLITVNGVSRGYNNRSHIAQTFYSEYNQRFTFDPSGNGNMVGKTSAEKTFAGVRNGDSLNYNLDYRYHDGYAHRAKQIGDMYYTYDGNGNLVTERFGSPAVTTGQNAMVSEAGGVYSTDYGFALTHPDARTEDSRVYQRDYRWNERNQLIRSVDNQYAVEYRYGADGNRANKFAARAGFSTETLYFNRMYQVNYRNNKTEWVENKHIFVGDTRIVTKRKDEGNNDYGQEHEEQYFYHGDHLGSAQLVTDYRGEVYEHLEYTPYGELWVEHAEQAAASVDKTAFRFTGKERDGETGLYYYGARYLNPQTSLWLSADPAMGEYIPAAPINDEVRERNGNLPGMGGVYNYVNLHVYHYAGNNPVKYTDPDGRWVYNNTDHWVYVKYENPVNDSSKSSEQRSGEWLAPHSRYPASGDARVDGVIIFDDKNGITVYKVSGDESDPIINISVDQGNNGKIVFSSEMPNKKGIRDNVILFLHYEYIYDKLNIASGTFKHMASWISKLVEESVSSGPSGYIDTLNKITDQYNKSINGERLKNNVGAMPYY